MLIIFLSLRFNIINNIKTTLKFIINMASFNTLLTSSLLVLLNLSSIFIYTIFVTIKTSFTTFSSTIYSIILENIYKFLKVFAL